MHELHTKTHKKLLLAARSPGCQLAFVSACHSEKAGQVFLDAGIPHVVAVRLRSEVYDDADRTFERQFYLSLALGKTVRQSYDSGCAAVAAMADTECAKDADRFVFLPEDGNHNVSIFPDTLEGAPSEVSPVTPTNNLRSKAEDLSEETWTPRLYSPVS